MNITEIGEDLEQLFGKPIDVASARAKFMLSLFEEEDDGKKQNLSRAKSRLIAP